MSIYGIDSIKYIKLAQVYAIIKEESKTDLIIEKCIQDINYQIPKTSALKNQRPDLIGSTILHLSLENCDIEILKMLINLGADVTIQNDNSTTVLHEAMECKSFNFYSHRSILKDYCKMEGKINHPTASLLLIAQIKSKNEKNPCNKFGLSHFHIACMLNHVEAVEFFLINKIVINHAVNTNSPVLPGFTALHIAARYSSFETVKILLKHGADTHIRNAEGKTPMQMFIARNMQIMDWINTGKRISINGLKEELEDNEKIIKFFLKYNGDDAIDKLSLFHIAATLQDTFIIRQLLNQHSKKVDINQSVSNDSPVWPGYTAIHFATHCNIEIVKLLLNDFGANILATDANGITPFDLCLQRYETDVVLDCIESKPIWDENIKFSGTECKLSSFVYSMREKNELKFFIEELLKIVNVHVPFDSSLWPGCTPLHLAVMFLERKEIIGKFNKHSSKAETNLYRKRILKYNCTAAEESLYLDRIKLCLNLDADVTAQDAADSTPLHLAFRMQKTNVVKLLLKFHKKIVDPVDLDDVSHLHIACAEGCYQLVEQLLKSGANVNRAVKSSLKWRKKFSENSEEVCHISIGMTPLHIAVACANVLLTNLLIRSGANLYAQDINGLTPIHLILKAHKHHKALAQTLFARPNLRECVASCGLTHLHVASYVQNANAVKALFKHDAHIKATIVYLRNGKDYDQPGNLKDSYFSEEELTTEPSSFLAPYSGCTPLHLALKFDQPEDPLPPPMILDLQRKHKDFVQLLVRNGADILAKNADGSTPLYEIVSEEVDSPLADFIFKTLISKFEVQKRILDENGLTMLHIACYLVDINLIKKLLRQGTVVNARAHLNSPIWPGCTPLHILVSRCRVYAEESTLQLLLDKGADITLAENTDSTPIHDAFMKKNYRGLKTLLNYHKDFNVNPVNYANVTHLHAACAINAAMCVKQFLDHNANVNHPIDHFLDDYAGNTPLHVAVYKNCKESIILLLQHGVDCNAENTFGETPLHVLFDEGHVTADLLTRFIEAGADISARTVKGEALLGIALKSFFTDKINDMVQLLLEFGCRINDFNLISNEGYVAIALKRYIYPKTNDEYCMFKSIMNARDINRVDKMGRNVIHNIVSVHEDSISSEKYTELIGDFAKNGCDIDLQDRNGQTAMHYAVKFLNKNAMVGLLANGADVNITDINNKSAFDKILDSNSVLNMIFANHVFKMHFYNLFVSNSNLELADEAERKFSLRFYSLEHLCCKECEMLKTMRIESLPVTLYELINEKFAALTYSKMPQLDRRVIDQFFQTNDKRLRKEYPESSSLLFLQYRKAVVRATIIVLAKISLNILANMDIPNLCSEIIFKYLKHDELKILIASTDVKLCSAKKIKKIEHV